MAVVDLARRRAHGIAHRAALTAAFERIARYGDGWYAPTNSVEQLTALMKPLSEACAAVGRDPTTVEVSAMWIPPMEGVDAVPRYADLGVSRLVVPVPAVAGEGDLLEGVARFAEEIVTKLQ